MILCGPTTRLVALVATLLALLLPASAGAADLLPDLDQSQPGALAVQIDETGAIPRFHLGFHSSVNNVGAGPLIIDAHRADQGQPQMVADQTILLRGGGTRTVRDVGRLQYVYSADHNHWHYLGFDHYELRRASDYAFVAPDQKTGFCLGDRYDTYPNRRLRGEPAVAHFTGQCGRTQTGLLSVREGISVGYGDIYFANLEGQFVDVTGVPAGQYYVVHRVNADRHLRESDYSNDAASALISLTWPDGTTRAPSVKQLRACSETDTCPGASQLPPTLRRTVAERYARTSVARSLGIAPQMLDVACGRIVTRFERSCTVAAGRGHLRARIALERTRRGILWYRWSASGKGMRRSGRVRIGSAPGVSSASAVVPEPGKQLMALDDPLLDGVVVGAVMDEVPRLVRDPLGGLRPSVPAE